VRTGENQKPGPPKQEENNQTSNGES